MSTLNRQLLQAQLVELNKQTPSDILTRRINRVNAELAAEEPDPPVDNSAEIALLQKQLAALPAKSKARNAFQAENQQYAVEQELAKLGAPVADQLVKPVRGLKRLTTSQSVKPQVPPSVITPSAPNEDAIKTQRKAAIQAEIKRLTDMVGAD